ncbi:hypothetical protein [Pontibacter ramchanderi]|uniref:DUF4349 domain-containing protein n=1 Tax=Pontibacter ramchanderi TaxID=1179743 RepID=A0A2N3V304_9BACT|nr:hypothetical protein [Pontibacter ramchanderi]PKV76011.1 hypothetical protein BD749_0960 [Pontibacter ramchanderi]
MRVSLLIRGLLAFVFFLSLSACEDKSGTDPSVDLTFSSSEFLLEDLEALAKPQLRDGCNDKAFNIQTVATSKQDRHTLSYILPMLGLQTNQAATIRDYALDHQQATVTVRGSISIIHQQILMRANAERDAYLKAYEEDRITKAQLDEKLLGLQDRLTAELHEHEQKQTHLRVLHERRHTLLQNIETVLNPTQLQQWSNWRRSIPS